MATSFAIEFFRGEAQRIRYQMDPNPTGGIVGRTVVFTMRKKLDQNVEVLSKSTADGGIEVIDGPAGTADIILESEDTASFKLDAVDGKGRPILDELDVQVGIWQADVQWIDNGNEKVTSRGTVTLRHPARNFPSA